MKIAPIVARLQSQGLGFGRIGFAKNLNTIDPGEPLPLAFVYPFKETSGASQTLQKITQNISSVFAVVIAASHSDASSDPLTTARSKLFNALIGFEIDGRPIEFSDGEVLETTPEYILWRDLFVYARLVRQPLT